MSDDVLAAGSWLTNAELIADVARLHLSDDDRVLDPTYGEGTWWNEWRPENLVAHDLDPDKSPLESADFRRLPYGQCEFDAVAYDPPYVCPGGRKTSGIKEMHDRYGMDGAEFRTPEELQAIIDAGVVECFRVVKPGGLVLTKCKDYVWSGRLYEGASRTRDAAIAAGFVTVDRLEHVTTPGPQPPRTRKCPACSGTGTGPCEECGGSGRVDSPQVHARRNLSTLFVFRRPKRAKPTQEAML